MRTRARIWLTFAAGVALGLFVWSAERSAWPTAGIHGVIAVPIGVAAAVSLVVVPLVVGRWWVLAALLGPAVSLTIMQIAGFTVSLDDGTGPAWNYRTITMLIMAGVVMLVGVAVRAAFPALQSDQPG